MLQYGLHIQPEGALDFVALGVLNHRLDPGVVPFRKATKCSIHVSGAEFNVAANLADCFRLNSGVVSAMVDYPIGDLIAEGVRANGVKPFYKLFAHDGVRGPNMATIYSDYGYGVRAPVVFYNRANEAAAELKPGDFDWSAIFDGGVRWFHSGGIFAALSRSTGDLIIEGMRAAREAGAVVSFDLNYRAKLWNVWGGPEQAVPIFRRIVENVDVLVGNEEDLQKALGIPGPEIGRASGLDTSAFIGMIEGVLATYPRVKVIATTLRDVLSSNRHRWARLPRSKEIRTFRQHASSTYSIALEEETASRQDSSTGYWPASHRKKQSISAGRTAHCSRHSRGIRRWRHSSRLENWPRAVPHGCKDDGPACQRPTRLRGPHVPRGLIIMEVN